MPSVKTAISTYGFLLNGRWIEDGPVMPVHSPYTGETVAQVVQAGRQQADEAIAGAVEAFAVTRKMPAYERQRILRKVAEQIATRTEEFARTMALEAGKPIRQARAEVARAALTFSVAAEESTRIAGEYLPLDAAEAAQGRWGIVRRFPLGPISAITPFNFPVNLVAHKVAPAIAAGCTMVLKPAPQTPVSALLLARLVHEAGWPAGAFSVLPLSNADAAPLIEDERLKMFTFTGSSAAGWELKKRAGKKRVTLELGGNAAAIIHSDADLEYAAGRCVTAGFGYSGQSCIAVQRILVHESAFDRFLSLLLPRVQKLKMGDPLEEDTDIGPLIREADAVRAESWIEEAVAAGAKLHCGGQRNGPMLSPAILTRTQPQMKVNCMEVFAPMKTLEPYRTFDEAIARVNDSPYGLQAGVFSRDMGLIFRAFEEIETGAVIANDVPTFRIDPMPYGGVKDSGTGREGLRYAIEEMTERKLLVLNLR
ncbi:MAG TPA: aldehyde dehydrogenase family protein [Candidatus Saccharimonadales bacterium]|jgi:acyl-CoA reductase-like NAD-dependent aldehyde dehydrogenase|nr:aldehyde dehydrogenase family protein [Candidatus Saccharimonadales bacterium]